MKKDGIFLFFPCTLLALSLFCQPAVTPESALDHYLEQESVFNWSVEDKTTIEKATLFFLKLTSQKWRDDTWTHQLNVIVPDKVDVEDMVFLFISGGSNTKNGPNPVGLNSGILRNVQKISVTNSIPAAVLFQVPNQPLFDNLYEDQIISYTFHQFQKTGDKTWPLLFPMVKSAVKAMDAIQAFAVQEYETKVGKFLVSGASKRGWTTWLTAAMDDRVTAIAPMVIDVLNMPVQMDYQIDAWGDYSRQIHDYVELGLPQKAQTPEGKELATMVDPYAYRDRLDVVKKILLGTNDPYWPVDAVKHYYHDLPGEKAIHYTPNAGHGLFHAGNQALEALSAFTGLVVKGEERPQLLWTLEEKPEQVTIDLTCDKTLQTAELWRAHAKDRDFRQARWQGGPLDTGVDGHFSVSVEMPADGFDAFYVKTVFPRVNGVAYVNCTRVFVLGTDGLVSGKNSGFDHSQK